MAATEPPSLADILVRANGQANRLRQAATYGLPNIPQPPHRIAEILSKTMRRGEMSVEGVRTQA